MLGIRVVVWRLGIATLWAQTTQLTSECTQTVSGMCDIAAGPFLRGSTEAQLQQIEQVCVEAKAGADCAGKTFADELPQEPVMLAGFRIDQYEVTNRDFQRFVDATGYTTTVESKGQSLVWNDRRQPRGYDKIAGANWRHPGGSGTSVVDRPNYPVVHISWADAKAYCEWVGKRLPSAAGMGKSGRGTKGWLFPWGDDWEPG